MICSARGRKRKAVDADSTATPIKAHKAATPAKRSRAKKQAKTPMTSTKQKRGAKATTLIPTASPAAPKRGRRGAVKVVSSPGKLDSSLVVLGTIVSHPSPVKVAKPKRGGRATASGNSADHR